MDKLRNRVAWDGWWRTEIKRQNVGGNAESGGRYSGLVYHALALSRESCLPREFRSSLFNSLLVWVWIVVLGAPKTHARRECPAMDWSGWFWIWWNVASRNSSLDDTRDWMEKYAAEVTVWKRSLSFKGGKDHFVWGGWSCCHAIGKENQLCKRWRGHV